MRITCPHCGRRLKLKALKPGSYTPKCLHCGQQLELTIPAQPDGSPSIRTLSGSSPTAKPVEPPATTARPALDGSPATLLRSVAASIFQFIGPTINAQLPQGCRADEQRCVDRLEALMVAGVPPEQLVAGFAAEFRKNSAAYVDQPDVLYAFQADEILASIAPQLSQGLPQGCCLNVPECKRLLVNLLTDGTPPQSLVEAFIARVQQKPETYLTGLDPLAIARQIYSQLEPQLAASLPLGCTPNREACIAAIAALLQLQTAPEELVKEFAKMISSSPALLLNLPAHWNQPVNYSPDPSYSRNYYHSSAPVAMSRSELRG